MERGPRRLMSVWRGSGPMLAALTLGCTEPHAQHTHSLEACESVRVQGQVVVVLGKGDTNSLTLRGESRALAAAEVSEAAGAVKIDSPQLVAAELECVQLRAIELIGESSLHAVSLPAMLEELGAYGESRLTVQGVDVQSLQLRTSGNAALRATQVLAEDIHILAAGHSQVDVSGDTDQLALEVSGSAVVGTSTLAAQRVEVRARGRSSSAVAVGAHLSGEIADQAQLVYSGTPDISLIVSDDAALLRR